MRVWKNVRDVLQLGEHEGEQSAEMMAPSSAFWPGSKAIPGKSTINSNDSTWDLPSHTRDRLLVTANPVFTAFARIINKKITSSTKDISHAAVT